MFQITHFVFKCVYSPAGVVHTLRASPSDFCPCVFSSLLLDQADPPFHKSLAAA